MTLRKSKKDNRRNVYLILINFRGKITKQNNSHSADEN